MALPGISKIDLLPGGSKARNYRFVPGLHFYRAVFEAERAREWTNYLTRQSVTEEQRQSLHCLSCARLWQIRVS